MNYSNFNSKTMKNLFAMLLILCIGGAASAQQNPIERFYDKYQNDTNFTKIELSGKMFEMANHIEAETDEEIPVTFSNIRYPIPIRVRVTVWAEFELIDSETSFHILPVSGSVWDEGRELIASNCWLSSTL